MQREDAQIFEENKVCVLMGHCGTGKTFIFNKICGTEHKSGISLNSLTRGLAKHGTSFGD